VRLPLYQVDAFTDTLFAGNPAAVCPLPAWLPEPTMQRIAAENNLSETAFTVPEPDRGGFSLRWFTPTTEVTLCGHATLAAAWILVNSHGHAAPLRFFTRSGLLEVHQGDGGAMVMDFPALPPVGAASVAGLSAALGASPSALYEIRQVHNAAYYLALFDTPDDVAALRPDTAALRERFGANVIATAASTTPGVDFVSRFFAPASGVDEDPVTGSAHCTLAPFWAARLGRDRLVGRQISARGGTVGCTVVGDRVRLEGRAVVYLRGEILLPEENK